MHKFITLTLVSLPLSSPASASIINPAPVTGLDAGGTIHAFAEIRDPYSSQGNIVSEPFTGPGRTARGTTSSSSTAIIDLSHAPSISSMSEAGVHPGGSTSGENTVGVNYYFKIVGPTTTSIPVLVQAEGHTKVSGPLARATATFNLIGFRSYVINDTIESKKPDPSVSSDFHIYQTSFTVNQYYNLVSNNEYLVQISAYTFAANGYELPGPSLSSAFVDPIFSVGPGYSDYSLKFSAGISNSLMSTVPLPGSLPMFGAALLVVGSIGYGLKRKGSLKEIAASAI